MHTTTLQICLNPMRLSLLSAFGGIHGRYAGGCKDVYFIRWTGCRKGTDPLSDLQKAASDMALRAGAVGSGYFCAKRLGKSIPPEKLPLYLACYEALAGGKAPANRPFLFRDALLDSTYDAAFQEMLGLYQTATSSATSTMVKNFGMKLLYWSAEVLPHLYPSGSLASGTPKCLWLGAPNGAEYLFLVFLTRLGCDVAIFHPEGELPLPEALLTLSAWVSGNAHPHVEFPDSLVTSFSKTDQSTSEKTSPPAKKPAPPEKPPVSPSRPPVAAAHPSPPPQVSSQPASGPPSPAPRPPASSRSPLSYEQLAQMAPSVVMIEVLDEQGQCHKTGSGVFVGDRLILTNFHVVRGGSSYRIQMENDENSYVTNELLKYHSGFDLALLRLDGLGHPIPLYQGPPLARGQNIVAIGSPLGLFNSVSNGIIAGFRRFEESSMIQFTAPTSPGSSGGALLNQYGDLVGIITAGFKEGQNLNLAVDYQTIRQFLHGFLV